MTNINQTCHPRNCSLSSFCLKQIRSASACCCRRSPCMPPPYPMLINDVPAGLQGPSGARGPQGFQGELGPTGPTGPSVILSSYLNLFGDTQIVEANSDIVFTLADNVGTAFTFNTDSGRNITINTPGLYLVEWTIDLETGGNPQPVVGLNVNGAAVAISSNSVTDGTFSSGMLLNVTNVPYTFSLHNFTPDPLNLESLPDFPNSAASLRILKFADAPST